MARAKRPKPISGVVSTDATTSAGASCLPLITIVKCMAIMSRMSMALSTKHHLPVASSTRSTAPRERGEKRRGGTHHRNIIKMSFKYVQMPEQMTMMMASQYAFDFQKSLTELKRVKSKMVGMGTGCPAIVSTTCTAAPTCTLPHRNIPPLSSSTSVKLTRATPQACCARQSSKLGAGRPKR